MSNSTLKASGKLEKGIIATPSVSFFNQSKQPLRLHQKHVIRGTLDKDGTGTEVKKADLYDYGFDKMPI